MPPVNHAAISVGVVAVSVAVAAAYAVYENPEFRRMADDLRRRIAIALRSLGDGIQPDEREPRFNRPEDADGFLQSRNDAGVDADDETKRRQRDELMYWNAVRLEKQQEKATKEKQAEEEEEESSFQRNSIYSSTTFDSFLQRDKSSHRGTYVLNTGADTRPNDEGLIHRRGGGVEGVSSLNASFFSANPFSDEHGIDMDDEHFAANTRAISPEKDEILSDIYNATAPSSPSRAPFVPPVSADHNLATILFDAQQHVERLEQEVKARSESSHTADGEPGTPSISNEGARDAYASIQAWAQNSQNPTHGFYSPLPTTPEAPLSDAEMVSDGALTPTDSMSVISAPEGLGNETGLARAGSDSKSQASYDVISDDEDNIHTPVSWSEVGSVVSEHDVGPIHA